MSLSSHNVENIYRKMSLNATILPSEVILVFKDMSKRLTTLEQEVERLKLEAASKTGQRISRLSKDKIPSSSDD